MKITIVLPFLPPSLNRVAGRGPYNYREAKERFTEQVRLNWDVGPRCKACGSENIIVERMDRNDTARTHKTEY